jgi:hypothetical protein
MKTMLLCLLSVAASAQVAVTTIAKDDPATGLKIVTVLMTVKGDKPYGENPAANPAELGILCQQSSLGKQKKLDVSLTLAAGIAAQTGIPVSIGLQSLGIILTPVRFDEDEQPRQVEWHQTDEYPGVLIRNDFKFVRDRILKAKTVHIEVAGSQAGARVSSFDVSGFKQEYRKHQECKP